ncbi:MAG TPA: hypothetical protein VNZ49_17650 [Bacteroidia bacterium]|jgi:hypothetical protein|nr:hypothetical protein [Bacteroidia bacterium]
MKSKIVRLTFLIFVVFVGKMNAQSFQKQQVDLNIGFGLGNTFVGSGTASMFPPISASLEYGITDAISIGGYLGYAGATWRYIGRDWCPAGNGNGNAYGNYYDYTDTYSWSFYIIGLRGAYHFEKFVKNDKVDLYAGLMLGDDIAKYKYSTTDPCTNHVAYSSPSYGGFIWSGFAGCRYRFTDKVGIFGELGYGVAYLNLGLNLKF